MIDFDVSQNCLISFFPAAVDPGNVNVAFGAYRLIIRSTSFVDVARWKLLWSWSISQRSELRLICRSDAELALEPPEAARAPTRTPTATLRRRLRVR